MVVVIISSIWSLLRFGGVALKESGMTRLHQGPKANGRPSSAAGHQGSRTTAGPSRCRLALRAEKDYMHGDIILGQWQHRKIEESPAAALYPVSALVAIKVLTGLTLAQLRSARDPGPPLFFGIRHSPSPTLASFSSSFFRPSRRFFSSPFAIPTPTRRRVADS